MLSQLGSKLAGNWSIVAGAMEDFAQNRRQARSIKRVRKTVTPQFLRRLLRSTQPVYSLLQVTGRLGLHTDQNAKNP